MYDVVKRGMKESRKYPADEKSNPLMANEPETVYGAVPRAVRRPVSHGAIENSDLDVPEDLVSEEAYRYYHPEEELKSLSEIETPVASLKEMLKHGMTLEESERRITEKIRNFYRDNV